MPKSLRTTTYTVAFGLAASILGCAIQSSHAADALPAPTYDRSTRPDLPQRFTRPDNPELFDARVKQFRDQELSQVKIKGRFAVAVGGDIISTFPIAQLEDPQLQAILNIVRRADIAVANSESNIVDYSKVTCCLGGMMGPKETAADIKEMGFDLLNKASNHITDTGESLIPANLDILRDAGLVFAGAGRNLQEARAAAFLSTPKGRVGIVGTYSAVVACHQCPPASSNSGSDHWISQFANYQLGFAYGMPGVNPLRLTRYNIMPQADLNLLRGIENANRANRGQAPLTGPSDRLNLTGNWYMEGPVENRGTASYAMYPDDLRLIERSIRNGKEQSDFMVVGIHSHESRGSVRDQVDLPPDFLVEYARRAIDNGADLFAGSGPWDLRGIEIYKGRPIFYGMALMVGSSNNTPIGFDRYRDHGLDPFETDVTDVELNWTSWFGPNIITQTDRTRMSNSESAIAEAIFQDGRLVEIIITPMELFYDRPMSQMGIPRIAAGEVAQRILVRLQQLSKPLGTILSIKGDRGYVRIGADGRSQ